MHEQLWFTALLNKFLAVPTTALLNALGIHPLDPQNPIADFVSMQILVALLMLIFFVLVRMRLSAEKPGAVQHIAEILHEAMSEQGHDIIGHNYERYVPYVVTLFLFIVLCNLIGLVPGFASPTQFPYVPLGCAIATWVYYHFHGIRQQGPIRYAKHFGGPVWWLAPLMFPIEIISHSARIMSLTIRLYANMFAGEMVTLAFFSLLPIGVPIVFLGLHVAVSLLQAIIFALLAMIYLAGAVAEEH
jgi:F-type H+-transporting ATPase subunit a